MDRRAMRFPPLRLSESVDTSSAFETITDAVDRLAQAKLIRGFLLSSGSDRSQR